MGPDAFPWERHPGVARTGDSAGHLAHPVAARTDVPAPAGRFVAVASVVPDADRSGALVVTGRDFHWAEGHDYQSVQTVLVVPDAEAQPELPPLVVPHPLAPVVAEALAGVL